MAVAENVKLHANQLVKHLAVLQIKNAKTANNYYFIKIKCRFASIVKRFFKGDFMHQFKMNGYNIVVDPYSGSVHSVDDLAYDIIELFKKETKDEIVSKLLEKYKDDNTITKTEILDCYNDVCELEKSGKLFTKDVYENHAFDFKNNNTVVKALCLHIAHTCNLNCEYCFASQGKYHGERALMSLEVGKKSIDFLIKNSGTRRNLEVDFFGGEPLMNFSVVKEIVKYAREQEKIYNKNFRFTLTTNGLLIDDDVIDFANKEIAKRIFEKLIQNCEIIREIRDNGNM